MKKINELLQLRKIKAKVVDVFEGLRTREYHLELALDENVSRIRNIGESIQLAVRSLSAPQIRLDGPSGHVIIEVTTTDKPIRIPLGELLENLDTSAYALPLVLGKDMHGHTRTIDLAECPHLLIGGTTGAGKSVLCKTMLCSLAARHTPQDMKLILIDPKRTELGEFADNDYCLKHCVTALQAAESLEHLVHVMEARYEEMASVNHNDWRTYRQGRTDVPFVVIVIDELADLLLQDDKQKTIYICLTRLLQKARAAGIHIICNTQRPSAKVVDGVLKANMPTQIALKTTSHYDSRIIIGVDGAEKLVGKGDMLLNHNGKVVRIQGAMA